MAVSKETNNECVAQGNLLNLISAKDDAMLLITPYVNGDQLLAPANSSTSILSEFITLCQV